MVSGNVFDVLSKIKKREERRKKPVVTRKGQMSVIRKNQNTNIYPNSIVDPEWEVLGNSAKTL